MARKVDLAKVKPGDKVHFKGGSTAIIQGVEPADTAYTVTFADHTIAEFAQSGKVLSHHSRFTDGFPFGQLDSGYDMASISTPVRTPKSLSLSRAFNLASRRPGDHHSRHPALEFQTGNHLRGIAGRYKIPGNYTAPEYEDVMLAMMIAATKALAKPTDRRGHWDVLERIAPPAPLKKSWNQLVRLNPVLKGVKFDKNNGEEMFNAHFGVTSGFNVDDINFFLQQKHVGEGLPAKQAREMPVHGDRLLRIDEKAEEPMFWVASPQTAEKVEARLDRRAAEAERLEHQPSREFEKAARVPGVAGNYRYPHRMGAVAFDDYYTWAFKDGVSTPPRVLADKGLSCPAIGETEDVDSYLKRVPQAFRDALKSGWNDLVRLNPVLKKVKIDKDNVNEVYDAINGVASGFNADDINFYLEQSRIGQGMPGKQAHDMPVHGERLERIETKARTHMQWVASPKTARKIEAFLDQRKKRGEKTLKRA